MIFLFILLIFFINDVYSQEKVEREVKKLADEGVEHYKNGEYEDALMVFQRAYYMKKIPTLLYNMAKCYKQIGKVKTAEESLKFYNKSIELFKQYVENPDADAVLRAKAIDEIEKLNSLINGLKKLQEISKKKEDNEGEKKKEKLSIENDKKEKKLPEKELKVISKGEDQRTNLKAWLFAGIGGAMVIAGGIFDYMGYSNYNSFKNATSEKNKLSYKDKTENYALSGDILIAAGIVSSAIGLILFFTENNRNVNESSLNFKQSFDSISLNYNIHF